MNTLGLANRDTVKCVVRVRFIAGITFAFVGLGTFAVYTDFTANRFADIV